MDTIVTNRKARRDYHIIEKIEAGIELRGGEVKSVRAGDVSLNESFAKVDNNELFLFGLHIKPYACATHVEHDPLRPKRLLLHKREILRLINQMALKGCAVVPITLYRNQRGLIKVQIALCKGKNQGDKRETLKRKEADREAQRAMSAKRYR